VSTKQNEKKNNKKRREGSERVLNYMVDCIVKIKKIQKAMRDINK